ncbi:hypothetical protein V6Z11_A11G271900 [Gossypium hirsutum]
MLSWDRMCFPKGMEVLGFRDLCRFNVALLGRQVWQLLSCKDTLCFRILSAKYFSDGDVFHPKHVEKPSFTWQSIAKAACTLYDGFGWNVGRGDKIDIWHDNWGFDGLSSALIRLSKREVHEEKVHDLLNNEKDGWNERRVLRSMVLNWGTKYGKSPSFVMDPKILVSGFIIPLAIIRLSQLTLG